MLRKKHLFPKGLLKKKKKLSLTITKLAMFVGMQPANAGTLRGYVKYNPGLLCSRSFSAASRRLHDRDPVCHGSKGHHQLRGAAQRKLPAVQHMLCARSMLQPGTDDLGLWIRSALRRQRERMWLHIHHVHAARWIDSQRFGTSW